MQPGQLGNGVSNDGDIMRMIQDLQRQVRELAAANPFATMGLTPLPNALQVDGELDVKGPLSVDGTATFGGTTTIGGNAAITGTLSLPAGIINNAALASPVQYGSVGPSETNFAITSTSTQHAVASITIPTGFSQATVLTVANVTAFNSTATGDGLYVRAFAATGAGGTSSQFIPGSSSGTASASAIQTLTGLSGGTIQVGCYVYTAASSWPASAATIANVNAIVLFSR